MKRITTLLILFIGPAFVGGLVSCDDCNPEPSRFHVDAYTPMWRKTGAENSNPGDIRQVVAGDTVGFRQLQLLLAGTIRMAYQPSGGGSSAFACDPAVIPLDLIKSLSVISDQPYRSNLPAGSDLTTVLTTEYGSSTTQSASAYFNQTPQPAQSDFLLTFLKAPDKVLSHRFTVVVGLTNGTQFTATSLAVVIKP